MSLPVMHTAVGVGTAFLAGLLIFLKKKRLTANTLILVSFLMIIFGIWAEVPDIPRFFPPPYNDWLQKIHHNHSHPYYYYLDIFFFHASLDAWMAEDRGELAGFFILFGVFSSLFAAASYSVMKNEKELESLRKTGSQGISLKEKVFDFKDMVDTHCHVLPGVDDGPQSLEESIKMCRRALELGVVHIIATPHLPWQEKYEIDKIKIAYSSLKEALAKENLPLELSLGSDIRIAWDLIEKLKRSAVLTIAGSRYFLLELDDLTIPPGLDDFIKMCNKEGFYPVLTHPERNILLRRDYERLKKLAQLPMLIQISSCSLVGSMGPVAKRAALDWLKLGLVDIIASDAHAVNMRLEEFKKGLYAVRKIVEPQQLKRLIITTPRAIVENKPIGEIKRKTF